MTRADRTAAADAISQALAEVDVLARVLNEHCVAPLREHLIAAHHALNTRTPR